MEGVDEVVGLCVILIETDDAGLDRIGHFGRTALASGRDDDIIKASFTEFGIIEAAVAVADKKSADAAFVCPDGEVLGVGEGVEEFGGLVAPGAHILDVDVVALREKCRDVAEVVR